MSCRSASVAIVIAALGACARAPATSSAAAGAAASPAGDGGHVVAANDSVAGAYLTIVGGCNDCHTPNWAESNGRTPAAERLVGSAIGYRGPWGTSYAANLRILPPRMTEDRWVQVLTTADGGHGRPPMPWMNTGQMSQRDLRNLYRYVRSLGPRGDRMPRAVAPDSEPTTPYILFVPQQPRSRGGAD